MCIWSIGFQIPIWPSSASSLFYYIWEIFICVLMSIQTVMTPGIILEDYENSQAGNWCSILLSFLETAKGQSLRETSSFAFSSISFKRFQIAGSADIAAFFTVWQTLEGTEICQYNVFPLGYKQLNQTEILLFTDKVNSLTWPGTRTFNMPVCLFGFYYFFQYTLS